MRFKLMQKAVILHATGHASSERVSKQICRVVLGGAYHGPTGTGHINNSRRDNGRSVRPAAIAGVRGCHFLGEPLPRVGSGSGKATRKLA